MRTLTLIFTILFAQSLWAKVDCSPWAVMRNLNFIDAIDSEVSRRAMEGLEKLGYHIFTYEVKFEGRHQQRSGTLKSWGGKKFQVRYELIEDKLWTTNTWDNNGFENNSCIIENYTWFKVINTKNGEVLIDAQNERFMFDVPYPEL